MTTTCKTALTSDVVNYHSHGRITNVRWNETTKSLLTSSIPQLQSNLHTISNIYRQWSRSMTYMTIHVHTTRCQLGYH